MFILSHLLDPFPSLIWAICLLSIPSMFLFKKIKCLIFKWILNERKKNNEIFLHKWKSSISPIVKNCEGSRIFFYFQADNFPATVLCPERRYKTLGSETKDIYSFHRRQPAPGAPAGFPVVPDGCCPCMSLCLGWGTPSFRNPTLTQEGHWILKWGLGVYHLLLLSCIVNKSVLCGRRHCLYFSRLFTLQTSLKHPWKESTRKAVGAAASKRWRHVRDPQTTVSQHLQMPLCALRLKTSATT